MDVRELKRNYYLFDPKEYGRIFAFVDFSNVRHWAKSFWPEENKKYLRREIDIYKLSEVIDFVKPEKKFFYYGHYREHPGLPSENPFNIKFRQSIYRIDKARKAGFHVRTKDIKEIDHFDDEGKFLGRISKCNFDVEMAMDMLLKLEKYDSVFLWSGDSDFHYLLQHLKSKKKKTITICGRDFASEELRHNSDLFIPADPLRDLLEYIPKKQALPAEGREA
jgi:uncharacterized LabA/DUF88 family protein